MAALKRVVGCWLLVMGILFGFALPGAGAACRIVPPGTPGICTTYTLTEQMVDGPNGIGRPSCTNPSFGTHNVCCDTQEETNNVYAVRSPICGGSSPETPPACTTCGTILICHGNNYRRGRTDAAFPTPQEFAGASDRAQALAAAPGTGPGDKIWYNGGEYTIPGSGVYFCDSNVFGCNNPACGQTTNPNTQPNFTGQSQTDARIYFPHVKNTSSITYLLQSMFRPISWTVADIIKNVVYSQVFEHQGQPPDNTLVINLKDNNSSVIPNRPAPTPVFDFTHPPSGVPADGACVISNLHTNPGDDLLGKKIFANLEYTQKFEYDLLTNCVYTDGRIGDKEATSACCSGSARPGPDADLDGNPDYYLCNPKYINPPTKGKTLVYTKSPFLEYLYQNLVAGPAAIYKRFVSQDTAKDIEDIPTKATYLATATETTRGLSNNLRPSNGLPGTPTDIYFPHLGSIYDNFLKNLQKLLRPKDTADTTRFLPTTVYSPGQTPLNPTCQSSCSHPNLPASIQQVAAVAGSIYNVPPSLIIGMLWSEGGLNNPVSDADVRNNLHPSCNCPNGASGACGPAQIIGSADGFLKKLALPQVQALAQNLGWDVSLPYEPNRCTYSDSIFEIADKLQVGRSGWDYSSRCNPIMGQCESQQCLRVTMNNNVGQSTSCNWSDVDVITAARQYLGYCEEQNHQPLFSKDLSTVIDCRPDPTQCYDNPTNACKGDPNECYQQKLLNFLASNCQQNFTPPASAPAAASQPTVSGGGFTVSGTFTQICQAVGFGIRQQAGTNNCVRCLGGQIASGYGLTSNVFPCPIKMQNINVCSDVTTDFATTPIPNDSTVDKPNGLDNWPDGLKARCFQGNVIDIQPGSIIDTSQGQYSCPLGQFCRVGDTAKSGIDTSCQPQICSNPGVKVGSGVTGAGGQGYYCCAPKP